MEKEKTFLEPLFENVEAYSKTSYELIKLKTTEKLMLTLSAFVSRGLAVLILSIFIVFIGIGLSLWLGDLLGKTYYGFFCVAGFYGIVGGILYFWMHQWIKKRISNSIILQMLN